MTPPEEPLQKRYYSISEVAAMFEVSTSLIRFWENEFDMLKPHKNAKGDRRFTPENIEQLRQIYRLVKERGFTLQGAKQEIRNMQESGKKKAEVLHRLRELRQSIKNLKDQL
jgi:DNA-binding transcriptional MerR regulator